MQSQAFCIGMVWPRKLVEGNSMETWFLTREFLVHWKNITDFSSSHLQPIVRLKRSPTCLVPDRVILRMADANSNKKPTPKKPELKTPSPKRCRRRLQARRQLTATPFQGSQSSLDTTNPVKIMCD